MREVTVDLTDMEIWSLWQILETYETEYDVEQMAIKEMIDALEEADEIVKDYRAIVSQRSVETVALELQYLIDKTEHDRPDPLTDVVFQARDELAENLGWEDFR